MCYASWKSWIENAPCQSCNFFFGKLHLWQKIWLALALLDSGKVNCSSHQFGWHLSWNAIALTVAKMFILEMSNRNVSYLGSLVEEGWLEGVLVNVSESVVPAKTCWIRTWRYATSGGQGIVGLMAISPDLNQENFMQSDLMAWHWVGFLEFFLLHIRGPG